MAKGYSKDIRVRAIKLVEAGESAREAARILNIGVSTAIRWADRWRKTGSVDAKPGTGHCRSPLERHKQWLIDQKKRKLIEEAFGWGKTIGGLARPMRKGKARMGFVFTFTMAAYHLVRLPRLLAEANV